MDLLSLEQGCEQIISVATDGAPKTLERFTMALASSQEFIIGQFFVRVYAAPIALPGVEGWVGAWSIYEMPLEIYKEPVRIGDTGVEASEVVALGMAKTIASAVAASL